MAAPNPEEAPWYEYRRLILSELERLGHQQETMITRMETLRVDFHARLQTIVEQEIGGMRIEIAMLKVKAGVWGAIAGLIPAGLFLLYFLLKQGPP